MTCTEVNRLSHSPAATPCPAQRRINTHRSDPPKYAGAESLSQTSPGRAPALLRTALVTVWDTRCSGAPRGRSSERRAPLAYFSFPYRGVYAHWIGARGQVVEPNQMVIINADEPYRVSHPTHADHATLDVAIDTATLSELLPAGRLDSAGRLVCERSVLRMEANSQLLASQLRQRLSRQTIDTVEAESVAMELIRGALPSHNLPPAQSRSGRPRRMAENVKALLATDPRRRWTLVEIADVIGVTPVYLTDSFRRVEGIPLYQYHLRLRLACALDGLDRQDDLTALAFDVGFSSHSHFSSAFKKTFGQTPSQFRESISNSHSAAIVDVNCTAIDRDSNTGHFESSLAAHFSAVHGENCRATAVVA